MEPRSVLKCIVLTQTFQLLMEPKELQHNGSVPTGWTFSWSGLKRFGSVPAEQSSGLSPPTLLLEVEACTRNPAAVNDQGFQRLGRCFGTHLWFCSMSSLILWFCSSMRELFSKTSFFKHSFSYQRESSGQSL